MKTERSDLLMQNKVIVWIALATGLILLVPLVAMQLSNEVVWSLGDFVIAGLVLFSAGFVFVLLARRTADSGKRILIGVAVALVLAWVWIELAVGLFTDIGS